jgi:hypothetical protein
MAVTEAMDGRRTKVAEQETGRPVARSTLPGVRRDGASPGGGVCLSEVRRQERESVRPTLDWGFELRRERRAISEDEAPWMAPEVNAGRGGSEGRMAEREPGGARGTRGAGRPGMAGQAVRRKGMPRDAGKPGHTSSSGRVLRVGARSRERCRSRHPIICKTKAPGEMRFPGGRLRFARGGIVRAWRSRPRRTASRTRRIAPARPRRASS